jgi:hypothetical protein
MFLVEQNMSLPKIIIHERPDHAFGRKNRLRQHVFCWFYNPLSHEIVRFPTHMKNIRKVMGNIPGLLVERSRKRLEMLMEQVQMTPAI